MTLLFQDQPFRLVIALRRAGRRSSCPSSPLTLLWLLNSSRTPGEWRNGWLSNAMLALAGVLFLVLCVKQVWDLPW